MSVLGLDSGYKVKYNPLPSGKGLYLTVYPSSRPHTDTVSSAPLDQLLQYVPPTAVYWPQGEWVGVGGSVVGSVGGPGHASPRKAQD